MKGAWIWLGLLLCGCGSGEPAFKIKDRSCGEKFTDWYPDLTHHILQGEKSGSFSYDPSGEAARGLSGSYDLDSGDFSWSEEMNSDHYLVAKSIEGYGYAKANGDLDIIGTMALEDVADNEWSVDFRIVREGCDMETRRMSYSEGESTERVETGTFGSDSYTYTRSTDYGSYTREETGEVSNNLDYTNTIEINTDGYIRQATIEGNLGDDHALETFYQESESNGNEYEFDGTIETFLDGSRVVKYDVRQPGQDTGSWDYELDYFGTGSGTYKSGNMTCDIEFDQGECTYDCGSGNQGSC